MDDPGKKLLRPWARWKPTQNRPASRGRQQSLVPVCGGDGKPSAAILPRRRNITPIVCALKLSASCKRPPMLCQINGNALAIVYLKTAGGRWEKVRYLRLSWKRSLRPGREAGVEGGVAGASPSERSRSRLDLRRLPSFLAEATGSREVGELTGRADWIF